MVTGIVLGILVSLTLLVWRASKSPLRRMAYDAAHQVYVEADPDLDATTPDGVLVVKLNGPLFFADAAPFRSDLLDLVSATDATTVVLDLEATPEIDLDGADILTKVHGQLADRGVRILLAHADAAELDLLRRAGTLHAIGETNVFETVQSRSRRGDPGRAPVTEPVACALTGVRSFRARRGARRSPVPRGARARRWRH